ncbi:hypothetical protein LOK49_Contig193G00003 [Camellia lanceoleosa]|nr:hypothetical protein LOK49_Contig193G00003 [Camellia lanceoleosa]
MEDEKKKKKNKKKKNKQTKTTGDVVTPGIGESTNEDQNHVIEQNHHYQVLETTDVQNEKPSRRRGSYIISKNSSKSSGWIGSNPEPSYYKHELCQPVGCPIVYSRSPSQLHRKLVVKSSSPVLCLLSAEDRVRPRLAWKKITTLQKENATGIQKEASLEETIKNLQKENDTHMQKRSILLYDLQASLEMKLLQLQSEKDSWLQKEAGFEEKINKLIDETAILSLKGLSLEEKNQANGGREILGSKKRTQRKKQLIALVVITQDCKQR